MLDKRLESHEVSLKNDIINLFHLERKMFFTQLRQYYLMHAKQPEFQTNKLKTSKLYDQEKIKFFYEYQALNILMDTFSKVNLLEPQYLKKNRRDQFKVWFD